MVTFAAPKYIFMFIGDGMGSSQRQITEYYLKEVNDYTLIMNKFPVTGIVTTHSLNSLITDSAAAGTALATGYKTNEGMIALLPSGKIVNPITTYAKERGMKTGIISTASLTDATPAVFAANNDSRYNVNEIAYDFLDSGIDFFAGGGYRNFIPSSKKGSKRKDTLDITKEFEKKGYNVFIGEEDVSAFNKLNADTNTKVFAALTPSEMPYEIDRINSKLQLPSLAQMTKKGIDVLSKGENGFFIMVEGGRIDHAAHAHDAKSLIYETLALDNAVKEAYEFYKENPEETLILVVGDHETGGLGLGIEKNYFLNLSKLKEVNYSIGDILQYSYHKNISEYINFIKEDMGLIDMTLEEENMIKEAIEIGAEKNYNRDAYGGLNPSALVVADILAKRAGIMFTSFAHTCTPIPLSAIGIGSENFSGFRDNTDIGKRMIELLE